MKIRLADIVIEVDNKYDEIVKRCKDYLVDDSEETQIKIEITPEERDLVKSWYVDNEGETVDDAYAEFDYMRQKYGRKLPQFDALLLHACLVEMDGVGYAFSANSGVGKSTHAGLWKKVFKEKVRIIDGDNPILKIADGKVYAYGTPCCGKEGWNINTKVPLGAICFIIRSKENHVVKVPTYKALLKLMELNFSNMTERNEDELVDLYTRLIEKVPFYEIHCNMDDEAAIVAHDEISKGVQI